MTHPAKGKMGRHGTGDTKDDARVKQWLGEAFRGPKKRFEPSGLGTEIAEAVINIFLRRLNFMEANDMLTTATEEQCFDAKAWASRVKLLAQQPIGDAEKVSVIVGAYDRLELNSFEGACKVFRQLSRVVGFPAKAGENQSAKMYQQYW